MVQARTITDFSVPIESTIDIDALVDYQALTSAFYTGTFNALNTYSLNADIDFSGETKSPIDKFVGTFNGNGHRLSNHDGEYIFDDLFSGAVIDGVVFHNFNSPLRRGIADDVEGTASITNCVCCGTFVTQRSAFCDELQPTVTFENNVVLLSGSSRILGGGSDTGGIVGANAESMTRCFFAGTSDVLLQGGTVGTLVGESNLTGENAANFNGYIKASGDAGGLVGTIESTPNGCVGMYLCGSLDVFSSSTSSFVGRFAARSGGVVSELYYYGSGDIVSNGNRVTPTGLNVNRGVTVFSERMPSIQGSNYLKTDLVLGNGLKGEDASVWAGESFAGPDILKNVPHFVPVENFSEIRDPIGTIQVHLTNKTDYPVFMRFNFDDPSVSFKVFDTEYREITGYKARIVSRHHALTNTTETVTSISGLEYYVNATSTEFGALVEPDTVIGTPAKTITDFSVYIGDIILGDFDDLSALHLENFTGTFHPANRYIQTADIQYPDSSTLTFSNRIHFFRGLYDGNGYRIIDPYGTPQGEPLRLSTEGTAKNISVHNMDSAAAIGFFGFHFNGSIVKNCKITGDLNCRGPALVGSTNLHGVFEDCQVLASGKSLHNGSGTAIDTANSVKRIFVATQPGHMVNSTFTELGGVMEVANSNVSKIACNMRSFLHCNRDEIGLIIGEVKSAVPGQTTSKGYYGCGDTFMFGSDNSMTTDGLTGNGGLNEFYSANTGDISMQTGGRTALVPAGRGTLFAEFTGEVFDQSQTNVPTVDSDVNGNQGALYSYDVTIWTAPWDLSSHLDYPSILIDVPHFIPIPDDESIKDVTCTIQMYADSHDGYGAFFKLQGDRYETDYQVDLVGSDGVPTPADGSWVVQFTFPFAVEATKNIIFRGSTLTSVDSFTYVIGGIPFAPFNVPVPTTECKNVADFAVHTPGIITMNDLADFQAVIGVTDFHTDNVYHMTADVDFSSITDTFIFNNFEGTFDGKGYRIKNRSSITFSQNTAPTSTCLIKNIIFQNTFSGSPVFYLGGRGKLLNCVSCGFFPDVLCGLVFRLRDFSSIERCYVLASGESLFDAGMSSNLSTSRIGVSKSFFCGASSVSIDGGNTDTGCIGRHISMGGGIGVNFLGSLTGTQDVGGLAGESILSNGLGYYVCGNFDILGGEGTIDRGTVANSAFDELYYANRGAITGGGKDITQGLTGGNHSSLATAFAEFTGTYNGVQITEDLNNVKNGGAGVYTRVPEVWWSPWEFVTTRPSFLRATPHFIPVESSEQVVDVLGSVTIEMEDTWQYPIFVRVDYVSSADMRIAFYTRTYVEITTGIAVEIVFPLEVTKNIYHSSSVVTSADNLTYNFGAPLGTLVPGLGPTAINASAITDFSGYIDAPILLTTIADIQAMYRSNYTGTFNALNSYFLLNDIDLHQETFDTALDRIVSFRGKFFGQGFTLSNHQGFLLKPAAGMTIRDVTFLDFRACAIEGSGHAASNLVFMSGSLAGTQTRPMLGDQNVRAPTEMKSIKVFIHGSATINNAAFMGTLAGGSELFLVTTSGVHSNLSNQGVMSNGGAGAFNIGCNVNGTTTMNNDCGVLMRQRNINPFINGGGYYATGKLDIVKANTRVDVWHTLDAFGHQNRADHGGVFTTVRGSVTVLGQDNLITNEYLGAGAGYQTAYKDFVQGIAEDQFGILGNMYDVNIGLWVAPWVLEDHLDHPSMLRAMPHYMAFEDTNTITSIVGNIRVITAKYPVFMEIKYTDHGDGTDSFTYTILDTTFKAVAQGAVVILTYPFPVRAETSIVFGGEAIVSADQLNYLLGDPIFFDKSSPLSFEINWIPIDNAESYELTYEYGTSGEIVLGTELVATTFFVQNLDPDTSYFIRLYSKEANTAYELAYTTTAVTAPNLAENYVTFVDGIQDDTTGVFDLSDVDQQKFELFEDIIEDVFDDGSRIELSVEVNGAPQEIVTSFVHKGSSVSVDDTSAILTSFNETDADQFIEIKTVDGNERMNYDPATKTVEIGGVTYNIGESIIIGGKKIKILDS